MAYQYNILYVPGKLLATADTLSRAPVQAADNKVDTIELFVGSLLKDIESLASTRLDRLRQHQAEDGVCAGLLRFCKDGWPKKVANVPVHLRAFWKERGNITTFEGLLLKDCRIVVPQTLQKEMLTLLHEGHQGVGRCKARARDSVWWPTLNSELEQLVGTCERCAQTRIQRCEPLLGTPTPDRPWQRIGVDLFELQGRNYVVMVDYYSRFPEVVSLATTTSSSVIAAMKSSFARFGIPETVVSDNGPQFSSTEFASFAASYGFSHRTSSPRYPQANGEAERMVRTLKELFVKAEDPHMALLVYRDTPGVTGYSPSELLMGRRLRTRLPGLHASLMPKWPSPKLVKSRDQRVKRRQRKDFNRRHAAQSLRPLEAGEDVWVQDIPCAARVLSPAQRPRSYVVETPRGVVQRNRRHLVPFTPSTPSQPSDFVCTQPATSDRPVPVAERTTGDSAEVPSSTRQSLPPGIRVTRSGRQVKPPQRLNL